MSLSVWHSIATVVAMVAFLGICWWAYSPSNKKRFDDDAQIALKTDEHHSSPETSETESREKP